MNSGVFCCEDFLALSMETCFLLLILVLFTLLSPAVFSYGVAYSKIIKSFSLQKRDVRVIFILKVLRNIPMPGLRNNNLLACLSVYRLDLVTIVKK